MPRHPAEFTDPRFELTDLALQMAESGVPTNFPDASKWEIFLRTAALRIPRDLMIRAYGWDPWPVPLTEFPGPHWMWTL